MKIQIQKSYLFLSLFFTIILFSSLNGLYAQNKLGDSRIEFELKDASNHKIIPLENEGVIVAYLSEEKTTKGSEVLVIDKFSTNLEKEYTSKINVPKGFSFIDYTRDGENYYILYANDQNGGRNTMLTTPYFTNYIIIKMKPGTKDPKTYTGFFAKTFHYKNFKATRGIVYLGGSIGPGAAEIGRKMCLSACLCYIPLIFYVPHYFPSVTILDMNGKTVNKKEMNMDTYGKTITNIIDLDINDSLNECNMLIKSKSKKEMSLRLGEIKDQKLQKESIIKMQADKEAFSGHINVFDNKKVIAGVYGAKRGFKSGTQTYTQGIFICLFDKNKQQFLTTVPYSKLNKVKVPTSKTEERMMKKSAKKGKAETSISLQILFHDFLLRENEIVVMGEIYYPTYHTETYTTTNSQGQTVTQTRTVFDGYEFSGGLTMGFDMAGKLLWDNGFSREDKPKTFDINYNFKFYEQDDEGIRAVFSDGNKIKSVIMYKDQTSVNGKEIKIDTFKEGDRQKDKDRTYDGNIEYWYDDYFIAYGEQKIKNISKVKEKGAKKTRTVFFLNKISIE